MPVGWHGYVTADSAILVGKLLVRGSRNSVEHVLDLIAAGWSFDQMVASYPGLTVQRIRACVAYVVAGRRPGMQDPHPWRT
jgi:uncharacterized protein (DUF433 family)